MNFENKGKWMSQIAESAELDSPENEEMALDMSEDEDIETQDEIEKDDEKDIEEISEEEEDTDGLIEDDLDLVEDEEIIDESSQKNEDNMSELKKELNNLYRGIGWAEWDYFKEGLAYSTNFKPNGMLDNDLEKMINASGIAKVKKVRDIKNHSTMEDFDPKDFRSDDKIIVTKKPMSSQFHGESSQKNEAMPPIGQRKRIEFEDDIVKVYDGNKEIYAGAEDYEPMQDEDWKWDNANKYYKFDKYIKVCCESAQKNEGFLIQDQFGMFFHKNDEESGWTTKNGWNKPTIFKTKQDAIKCIKDEYLGDKVKIVSESSQKNESLDERAIKDYLNKEHSRALKNIKNMSADDSDSFYKGYATAIHELQRKFNL